MRPHSLRLAIILLACAGCADLTLKSRWGAPAPFADSEAPEGSGGSLVLDASNDEDYLYLTILSHSDPVKSQFLGAFLQSLIIWFDPADRQVPQNGVRIAFHRQPGVGFPHYESEQKEYMRAATREVALLKGGWRGEARILNPDFKEIELKTEMFKGQLAYRMKLPLRPSGEKSWAIEAYPGQSLGIMLECTPIDPEIAQLELIREYEEAYLGWGWGTGANPYGPRQGYGPQKNLALGDYAAAGMDRGIYATHGVYRPISWASVPQRFSEKISVQLAPAP